MGARAVAGACALNAKWLLVGTIGLIVVGVAITFLFVPATWAPMIIFAALFVAVLAALPVLLGEMHKRKQERERDNAPRR